MAERERPLVRIGVGQGTPIAGGQENGRGGSSGVARQVSESSGTGHLLQRPRRIPQGRGM